MSYIYGSKNYFQNVGSQFLRNRRLKIAIKISCNLISVKNNIRTIRKGKMSASPAHYSEFIADFTVDMNQKMKVPSKISLNSDMSNGTSWTSPQESFNMHVPERILVVGQHGHLGTRAPPHEMVLDRSIIPTESPEEVRVQTPPRTLTLDRYPFPDVNHFDEKQDRETEKVKAPVVKPRAKFNVKDSLNDSVISLRESTPPIGASGDGLTHSEELLHLRRQMAKLHRRVMALESNNFNKMQKEKILYGLGIAYFLLKAIIWLNRSD